MKGKADIKLAITTVILVIFGIIMVYSASMYSAQYNLREQVLFYVQADFGRRVGHCRNDSAFLCRLSRFGKTEVSHFRRIFCLTDFSICSEYRYRKLRS